MAVAVNQWSGGDTPHLSAQPVRFYDTSTWRPTRAQPGGWPDGANVEYAMAFSGDGRRIAAGVQRWNSRTRTWEHTGAVMVWDVARPTVPVFSVPLPELAQVALSPDGRRLYVATTGVRPLRMYDVDSGRLLRRAGARGPDQAGLKGGAAISADGTMLAIATGSRIDRYDTRTLAPVGAPLRGHTGEVGDLDFAHDGMRLLSASTDRTAIVWDARNGTELRRLAAQNDQSWGAAFGAHDEFVYTTSFDKTLMSWDLTGRQDLLVPRTSVGRSGAIGGLSMPAPDGHTVARFENRRLWFADSRTGRTVPTTTYRDLERWAWAKDGHWFATTSFERISLWDPRTGRLVAEHDHSGNDAVIAFAADGRTLYVVDSHGTIEALDPATMQPGRTRTEISATVLALAPHPRDGTVFALKQDGSVLRFDVTRGRLVATSRAGLVSTVDDNEVAAMSPDGSRLAVSRPGGSVQLLDVDTFSWIGKKTHTPWGHNALFAPDGSQFASVQSDRVRLWDGRTGAYLASVPLAGVPAAGSRGTATLGPGVTIAYLPDSSGLLVAASDGRTWTVGPRVQDWVRRACATAGRNLTHAEWRQFFPRRDYHRTCPQWPAGV
jgi:WD40 repeat protein